MEAAKILIDEFGHVHLDLSKGQTSSHFIYASVIIKDSDSKKAEDLLKSICLKHRQGDFLKSKNLGAKYFQRRKEILIELVEQLDFAVDILVVDKSKIESDGLKQHRTFYKYFQSLFVDKYNYLYDKFTIIADKVGEEFAIHLQNYVREKSIVMDLFNPDRSFSLADEKDEKLLQLADFIAGCVGKVFCTNQFDEKYIELFDLIRNRTTVDIFPFENYSNKFIENRPEHDRAIMKLNYDLINKFLDNESSNNFKEKCRLLQYLRIQSDLKPDRFIAIQDINSYLHNFFPDIKQERIRTLIRDLRYEGLFIVSQSGKPGYKLATKYSDVSEHFNHFLKYVIPMLQKVKILNQTLSKNSFNEINPIEKDSNMQTLKELISGI